MLKIRNRKLRADLRHNQKKAGNFSKEIYAGPVPCFHCSAPSVACKEGKSMCRRHLDLTRGVEYPLRHPLRTAELRSLDTYLTYLSAASAI